MQAIRVSLFVLEIKLNSTTNNVASLQKLYSQKPSLLDLAAHLAVDMKAVLPSEPLEAGKAYQLPGKSLHGVDCLLLTIIPNLRAVCIDLSTGVVASVDQHGVRSTATIGRRQ